MWYDTIQNPWLELEQAECKDNYIWPSIKIKINQISQK